MIVACNQQGLCQNWLQDLVERHNPILDFSFRKCSNEMGSHFFLGENALKTGLIDGLLTS